MGFVCVMSQLQLVQLSGSGFMPARRRYAGYLDDADGAKIGDGQVQVA